MSYAEEGTYDPRVSEFEEDFAKLKPGFWPEVNIGIYYSEIMRKEKTCDHCEYYQIKENGCYCDKGRYSVDGKFESGRRTYFFTCPDFFQEKLPKMCDKCIFCSTTGKEHFCEVYETCPHKPIHNPHLSGCSKYRNALAYQGMLTPKTTLSNGGKPAYLQTNLGAWC